LYYNVLTTTPQYRGRIIDLIEIMPNKFSIDKFLEAKPFFSIRILLVDGLRPAWEVARLKSSSGSR